MPVEISSLGAALAGVLRAAPLSAAAAQPALNSGDTGWLLISSALTWSLNVDKSSGRCRVTATLPVDVPDGDEPSSAKE